MKFTTLSISDETHTKIIRCRGMLQYKNPKDKITMDKAMTLLCDEYINSIEKELNGGK